MNILLIEPDKILAETYKRALTDEGFNVLRAATAQGAVFASDFQTPDLIIMELQLVEHSGIEFLYELRSYPEWQEIPVLIHSSVSPVEFAAHANLLQNRLNVRGYLYKPRTTLVELISAANSHLKVLA